MNIGDINMPADGNQNNDLAPAPPSYHEKLLEKRNSVQGLLGQKVTISQGRGNSRLSMEWTVIKESIPVLPSTVVEARDNLFHKVGLKKYSNF